MRILSLTGLLLVGAAALGAVGCGDDDDDSAAPAGAAGAAGGGGDGGSDPGRGGRTGRAGGDGRGGSGGGVGTATLTGTWDLLGSYENRAPANGFLQLSEDSFALTLGGGRTDVDVKSIRFDAAKGALIALDRESPDDQITGTHEAGETMSLGALRLPVTGRWTLAAINEPQRACLTSLSKLSAGVRCQGVDELIDWEGDGALAVQHVAVAPSMFGDLGGTWQASRVLRDSPDSACELRFEGASVTLRCERLHLFSGTLRVTFDGDRASGTTDGGLEFAATRR